MATCNVVTIPPPPPPVEKKYVLELSELEAQVVFAVLSKVSTYGALGEVSYEIFKELSTTELNTKRVTPPRADGLYLQFPS